MQSENLKIKELV